ncbi:RHS repeat-associated core domain-containing protein [Tenacibaculum maritimum]|uniref:FG-GAP-like repeat-containing protein n=2 Tax=Tenacibaculum maritimum TaxID=107401 RepID=UPI00388F28FE
MKKKLYTLIVFLLFIGVQFSNAQDPNISGRKSFVEYKYKKTKIKTKRTSNEAKKQQHSETINSSSSLNTKVEELARSVSTEAGSTAGALSVSLTGAASYSIPIMVPPGIKDVVPNIAVSYTSQGANGLAGWGWNISGLSTISRIPATKYYDNKHDGIDFKDDRFSLDGQRLIIKSGTYGASGSVYQTENYSNVKVVAYGTSPYGSTYGPSYFIVYYPNGTRAWYGNSGNSRSRLEWAIFRWQDPQGNYVDYNYQSDNGLLSIKTIRYGGRIGGASPTNQINFAYISRSRPESVYVGGYSFKRTNLLKSIQVTASGSQYRKYELTHDSTSLEYQRLTSVKEYNAENKVLRPIVFGYEDTSSWIKDRVVSADLYPGFDYKTSNLIAGDYDGDGRTDVVFYDKNKRDEIYMHTKLYDSISSAYSIKTDGFFTDIFSSTVLGGDNSVLSSQAMTTIKEMPSSNSSFSSIRFRTFAKLPYGIVHQYDKVWKPSKYKTDNFCGSSSYYTIPKKYISGDFNGDGLTDVLAIEEEYTTTSCRKKDCDGGSGDPIDLLLKAEGNSDKKQARLPIEPDCCECNSYTENKYNAKVHFIDLKRDITSNFSQVSGHFRKPLAPEDRLNIGDHNGDGKQDIYHFKEGKLYIYTLKDSNNLILLREETDSGIKLSINNRNTPILMGDYNGDGKTDFMVATANKSNNWRYFMSKGTSFYKQTKSLPFAYHQDEKKVIGDYLTLNSTYYEYRYTAQDVNGDGKTDLIMHNVNTTVNYGEIKSSSAEYISIYKSNQTSSSDIPIFSYETGYTDTSGEVGKYGFPIFLESNITNGNLEYGYISVNNIFMYEFAKDHRKDATLRNVTNNGVKTTIDYERLGIPENEYDPLIYRPDRSQSYPYVNINKANSFQLVKKLTEEGAGIKRYQDFLYQGAVSNVNIGFQGFLKTKRSNWYGDDVSRLWTISKYDITKKGIVTDLWVATSPHETSNYMSKTTNTFNTSLTSNKVFSSIPTKVVQYDALTGVTTTKTITYDAYKNPLTENTVYNGGSENITYTYSNNSTVSNQHYHIGRITKKVAINTIGGNAFTTEEEYNYSNNLLTEQKVRGNGTPWNTESFTYDAFGNVTKKTLRPNGLSARTENFKYDASGRFLMESMDVEGLKTMFSYDSFGNPLTTTNPFNQVTTFSYDGWNRLVSEKNYLGKITTFSYAYLDEGGLLKTTNYPQGAEEVVEYNALGWILKSRVLGINNKWTQKSFQYDVAGKETKESEPYFSSPSQWNTTAYDSYGRTIAKTSFNGLVANITYNGLVTTVDDGTKTVKTTKDGSGNIIKKEDPGGIINYTYFGNGVMKSANYGSHVVRTEIDGWGRKTKLTDPSAGTYTYKYNNLGEVLEETTPKGKTIYTYDGFGKTMTKKILGNKTNLSLNYTYDPSTKLLKNIWGKNHNTNEDYAYVYEYDAYKRLEITTEYTGKAVYDYRVTRDDFGRVAKEAYWARNKSNGEISYVKTQNIYDAGVVTEILDAGNGKSLWKLKEVNERGQAKEVLLGNGMVKKRSYDEFGFLTKMLDQTVEASPKKALDLAYSFDTQRGNLRSRKNNNLGWNESFTYDNLDRLTNISGSVNRSQQYDERGRITSNSEIGEYNYTSTASYHLQEVDLNTKGDLYYQNQPIQKITYNAYKKPLSISVKDKARVDFEYGILQNRSHAYYGGNEANKLDRRYHKHYAAIAPIEIEEDKQGNTKIITYIGGDAYTAPVVYIKQTASGSSNGYHYVHRDYLGSLLGITDTNANVLEQRQFGAWGEVDKFKSLHSEIDFEYGTTLLNRGYTGHEHFMGVALIHMNGRMYDAKLGRFLSPDNFIQEPFSTQSFNRFGYVWNNPLKFTDPSGEEFITAVLIGALISVTTNGIINLNEGRPFFQGAGLAALTGAIGGAFAFGIGEAVSGLKGFLKVAVQTLAHGHLGGVMSVAMGGDYFSGFAAGAVGSAIGHYAKIGLEKAGANNFWKASGIITAGSLSGGVGSFVSGGKFWDGFRNGAISTTLNHVIHMVQKKIKTIRSTREALKHYFEGEGESVKLHPDIKKALINSKKFNRKLSRILGGKTTSLRGNFSIDLTKEFFHVGRTNIEYSINFVKNGKIRVDFNLFINDGFWDADFIDENTLGRLGVESFKPDGLGPNLERFGGIPYRYLPQTISYKAKNPGYLN